MRWFTGEIGFHHVHHLNASIPFYRLAEAMGFFPELQHPVVTTLRPRDVLACFRLKLWDEARGEMVDYDGEPVTP
jgi:omega-6 fatty acid desaturase (delta-12 desaturase)